MYFNEAQEKVDSFALALYIDTLTGLYMLKENQLLE